MNINGIFDNKFKKTILTKIILFCIFSFCLVYFLIIPSVRSIKQKSQEMIRQKVVLDQTLNKKSNSEIVKSKSKDFEERISAIDSNFMKRGDELNLIKILETIATQNGVTQTISPTISKDVSENLFYVMNLKLNITGSFKNVLSYVRNIESLQYYINITSINIVKSEQKLSDDQNLQNLSTVSCTIVAETYWK
ncbi:MAG TPA: type 4a pilus biogenesis protein PilO [bacterium]|nr:type 4a pilus biogenesis protein PilO [bacterium]